MTIQLLVLLTGEKKTPLKYETFVLKTAQKLLVSISMGLSPYIRD